MYGALVALFFGAFQAIYNGASGLALSIQGHDIAKRAGPPQTTSPPAVVPLCSPSQVDLSPLCASYKMKGYCKLTSGDHQDFMEENCVVTCGNCRVPTTPASPLPSSYPSPTTRIPMTPHQTTLVPGNLGQFTPRLTVSGPAILGQTTTTSQKTLVPTTLVPTTPGNPSGNLTVTLVVFSGRPDPQWEVSETHQSYDEIQRLLGHARTNGFVYDHENMPTRLGYKGILLKFVMVEYLVVGPNTRPLQELLMATMPVTFQKSVLAEVRSGVALPDTVVTRRKRFAPSYNPNLWNNHLARRNNNCYNYANDKVTNTFAQPGKGGSALFGAMNGAAVQAAAVRDGLVVLKPQPGPSSPIPTPPVGAAHLVALFVNPGNFFTPGDFHWARLDNNGRWSHKPGQARVTDLDQNGSPIIDPRKANMGNYVFVCFMTSNKNIVNIA